MMNSILGDFLDKFALVYLTTSQPSAVPKKTISSMFDWCWIVCEPISYTPISRSASSTRFNWSLSASRECSRYPYYPSPRSRRSKRPIPTNVQEVRQFIGLKRLIIGDLFVASQRLLHHSRT
ncbi:hypothetical protein O0I10_009542 [Lichtheimia ornata]|uniref:Uncharacterized protein n=1 Tax=Lichtheimia ornata TaxID=688661 RepID=A0AAD7UW99_9FUNG|nr:uncharacterized protein O0I10_009542 [Lichtheimia ornata]KAJ8654819.1 hypothetical protein O0I10_009542 [Lichtheimia ornata]